MELGRLGVWVGMDGMSAAAAAAFAKRVEDRGYGALWIPESRGRNALVLSSWLLCQHQTANCSDRNRKHLRARPDGDGGRSAHARRAIRRPLSAWRRGVAPADGRRRARPHLREARRDDARLSAGNAGRALSGPTAC